MTKVNRTARTSSTSRTSKTKRTKTSRSGSLFSSRKPNNTVSASTVAQSLKDDIYAKKFGIPTTGPNIGKHVSQVNSTNVREVMNKYAELTGNKETLFSAILDEYGLPESEREAYVKHIFYARMDSAKKEGIYIDDIKKDFDSEIKKKGLISKKYVNALYTKLIKRTKKVNANEGQVKDRANGKVDKDFKQGKTGDCWLLAGIEALSQSPRGLKALNDSLKVLPDGSVRVTLKGVGKEYVISRQEINNAKELSTGDADVRAIEIAMNRYFKEEGGVRNRVDINGNKAWVLFKAITGKGGKNFFQDTYGRIPDRWFSDSQINNFNKPNHIAVVSASGKGSETFASPSGGDSVKLLKSHAYTVKGSDSKYVYLINPHNTSKVIAITREDFKEFFNSIDEFDL
ncbi:MAG: calpain family cysteine protease [Muribaculaceae bacterium]|nr:calpain family cysteine protease [Muribaculaceae bacterium]